MSTVLQSQGRGPDLSFVASGMCLKRKGEKKKNNKTPHTHIQNDFFVSRGTYVSLSPSLSDKVIRHRACSLKDTAHAIFASELDPEFDRMCEEIKEARKKRGKKREPSLMGRKKKYVFPN